MKTHVSFILLLTIIACTSTENKSDVAQDTVMVADTTTQNVTQLTNEGEQLPAAYYLMENDTTSAAQLFDSLKDSIDRIKDTLYQVSVSTEQYEATSDVTWYFDAEIQPVYFYERWASEGSEGSTEYIISGKSVVCASITENSTDEKWCLSTGGNRTEEDETDGEGTTTALDASYGSAQNQNLKRNLELISSFLREAEVVDQNDEWIILQIKNVVNYGAEYTETTEMRINRKVYDELK